MNKAQQHIGPFPIMCTGCVTLQLPLFVRCPLCTAKINPRKPASLSKCLAYLVTAIILFIPANIWPTMSTTSVTGSENSTILSGIIYLWNTGDAFIATIVFLSSFVTPLFKMMSIGYLCYTCWRSSNKHRILRTKLYVINEKIGRWSMVDVFVVAILGALVNMGALATIEPKMGIVAFALMVVCSMLSLQQLDPRLIWDEPKLSQP